MKDKSDIGFDLILVGAGLANLLIAWTVARSHPRKKILIVDEKLLPFSSHTWSFHESDIPEGASWVLDACSGRWANYSVDFPDFHKTVELGYASLRSEDLQKQLFARPEISFLGGSRVSKHETDRVYLEDGRLFWGKIVIAAKGWPAYGYPLERGYQKFFGQFLKIRTSSPLSSPQLMDARVDQTDGFHFIYALPFTEDLVLIEDTYYNTSEKIDRQQMRRQIRDYAAARNWEIIQVVGEEEGVLPIPLSCWRPKFQSGEAGVAQGYFHVTTGYSFPIAIRHALLFSSVIDLPESLRQEKQKEFFKRVQKENAYFFFLNKLLFRAARPYERWQIFRKFYSCEKDFVSRFYRANLRGRDKLRMFLGHPPLARHRMFTSYWWKSTKGNREKDRTRPHETTQDASH